MSVIHVTNENFESEVLKNEGLVLVDFWAPWCGPCRMLGPILEDLEKEMGEKVKVCKVNVDEESSIAQQYGIMSIPAVFLFKNGEIAETMIGLQPKESFEEAVKKYLG